ncbi:MAG: phage integrase N-terminal SAM-like domain-containing protein, partial [Bacteroidales bacterium]|nr:phage integrase N-terminal SAM-like domain-containing protein [Bacteroidales bacterium]
MTSKKQIKLSKGTHNKQPVVFLEFAYDRELIEKVRLIKGACWSRSRKVWYIPETEFNLNQLFQQFKGFAWVDYSEIKTNSNPIKAIPAARPKQLKSPVIIPEAYRNLLEQKRYSKSTIATYINYFQDYVRAFKNKKLEDISTDEINHYILDLIKRKNISSSQQNQRINAIKFFYEKVLGRQKEYYNREINVTGTD